MTTVGQICKAIRPNGESSLDVSVVVPFDDRRGDPRHLKSWTQKQTCPGDRFELIAVTVGAQAYHEDQIRRLLRPQDQLIQAHELKNKFEVYDIGASHARGGLLLFTEDHCVGDRACVEEVIRFFETEEYDGAFVRSEHINQTDLAHMEQRLYEEALPIWTSPGHWDKVRIRGFALPRKTYFDVGGMDSEYGYFAEPLLSAKLHARGYRLGYASKPLVRHINVGTFDHLFGEIWDYAWGEFAYRNSEDPEVWEPYLQMDPQWSQRFFDSDVLANHAALATLRTLIAQMGRIGTRQQRREFVGLGGELMVRLAKCVGSRYVGSLAARCSRYLAQFRYRFWSHSPNRRLRAVKDYWSSVVRWARHAYLSQHITKLPTLGHENLQSSRLQIGEMSEPHLIGFHTRETIEEKSFRWTGPVAAVRLNLTPADRMVAIDTGSLRGPACDFAFGLFWNGYGVPRSSIKIEAGRITFPLRGRWFRPDRDQQLTIVSAPVRAGRQSELRDDRSLGMPILSVSFAEPITSTKSAADAAARKCA